MKPFSVDFDLKTALSDSRKSLQRRLKDMKGIFHDEKARDEMTGKEDTLVYEFYDLNLPETDEHIAFGTSITYPGKVGDEYFMTKGHFHSRIDTAEVYYCLRGEGFLLMEDESGNAAAERVKAGIAVYVPPGFAHRSINTSVSEPLITFFAFRGDAGHDYATIEQKGFRKLVVERAGKPAVIDNPRWK